MSIELQAGSKQFFLKKHSSLKTKKEFQDVFKHNIKLVSSCLVIYGKQGPHSRMGLVVSKKIGHAPCRNRTKRRLREIFRIIKGSKNIELVVIARKKASLCSYQELENSFSFALNKLSNRLNSSKKEVSDGSSLAKAVKP